MALWTDHEVAKLVSSGHGRQNLASVFIKIDHVQHDFGRLILVSQLHDQTTVVRAHRIVHAHAWCVGFRVLGLRVTTVQNASDCAHLVRTQVHLLILEIPGDPSAIHNDGVLTALSI